MLSNGQEIAVKRLSSSSNQGNSEFVNELMILARLLHRNLVKLLGFCQEGNERLLIYEFVERLSLDLILFGNIFLLFVWNINLYACWDPFSLCQIYCHWSFKNDICLL